MTTIETHISADLGTDHRRVAPRDMVTAALETFTGMVNTLMDWQYRARERRQLLGLSDRALQDFGATSRSGVRERRQDRRSSHPPESVIGTAGESARWPVFIHTLQPSAPAVARSVAPSGRRSQDCTAKSSAPSLK